jgi:cytidine deaminase
MRPAIEFAVAEIIAQVSGLGKKMSNFRIPLIQPIETERAPQDLCTPCGCRQRIREFAESETVVHIAGPEGRAREIHARGTVAGILWPRSSSDRVKGGAHQRE